MSEALLEARGIGKVFPMGRTRLEVLRGCELRVAPGEFVAIMGKSGSGKSTLLHILGALDVPTAGEVLLGGTPTFAAESGVARMAARLDQLAEPVQRGIMLVLKYLLLATLWACLLLILAFPFLVLYLSPALTIPLLAVGGVAAATAGLALLLAGLLVVRLLLVNLAERRQVGLRRRVFGFVFQFLPPVARVERVGQRHDPPHAGVRHGGRVQAAGERPTAGPRGARARGSGRAAEASPAGAVRRGMPARGPGPGAGPPPAHPAG
jgi:energy-coupling factor transporter ATP-binding protein EcfA2